MGDRKQPTPWDGSPPPMPPPLPPKRATSAPLTIEALRAIIEHARDRSFDEARLALNLLLRAIDEGIGKP